VCSAGPIVKSVQQADEMIAQDNQDLKAQQDYIKQTEDQLSSAPDDASKTRLEWRIQSRSATAARIQDEIASLKKQRDTLAKNAPAATTAAAPAGASSGPTQQ
jgi:FtsZ-binding cell division protein ZapB